MLNLFEIEVKEFVPFRRKYHFHRLKKEKPGIPRILRFAALLKNKGQTDLAYKGQRSSSHRQIPKYPERKITPQFVGESSNSKYDDNVGV